MQYYSNSDSPKKLLIKRINEVEELSIEKILKTLLLRGEDEYEPDVKKRVKTLENDILRLQEHNATLRILLNFLKAKIRAMTQGCSTKPDDEHESQFSLQDLNNNHEPSRDPNNNEQVGFQFAGEDDESGLSKDQK